MVLAQNKNEEANFDLMEILADFQNENDNDDFILAATQCEEMITSTNTTTSKRSWLKKCHPQRSKHQLLMLVGLEAFEPLPFIYTSIKLLKIHVHVFQCIEQNEQKYLTEVVNIM